jgi:hypothetical protein
MNEIRYSDGRVIKNPVIQIWEDNHTEARGNWYRAFWCENAEATSGSPVIGYCSAGGSQRTIRAAAREALRYHPGTPVFRNGKPVNVTGGVA